MEKKRVDTGMLLTTIVILFLVGLIVYENVRVKNTPSRSKDTFTQSVANEEYQVFEEFQFKVKCPATLNDVSGQSNDDFDFNYAGTSTDGTFYQIMIIKLPAGYKDYQTDDIKSMLREMFSQRGGGRNVLFGEEDLPAYLLNDYTQEGHRGRGIAVYRNGMIYTFNVITKGNLNNKFNSFTNSVKFLGKTIVNENQSPYKSDTDAAMKQYIQRGLGSYSISYPQDWILTKNPNEIVDVLIKAPIKNRDSEANVNVIVSKNDNTLETCFELAQEQCREYIPKYNLLSKEYISIEGLICIKTIAKANMQGVDIISISYQFKKEDNTLYTITFTVHADFEDSYTEIFNQIVQSFKLL